MSSLQAVQIVLKSKSTTIAVGSTTADVRQEQEEAAGCFQRTGPSGGPDFRRELTAIRRSRHPHTRLAPGPIPTHR